MNIYIPNQNDIIHETSVDFVLRPCTREIHIVQYDKSLPIVKVELFRNGERYQLPQEAIVNVRFGKIDHTFVYKSILGTNEERNIVYFEVSEQMATIPGRIWPVLEVIENSKVACSSPLCFIIERNPIQEGEIESHSDFPIIYELQGTVANHETRISNLESQVGGEVVTLHTNQYNIDGEKMFNNKTSISASGTLELYFTPSESYHAVTKGYIDQVIENIEIRSDVIDVLGTYQDLQNYDTSAIGLNDLIKVISDETHNNAISYYRWVEISNVKQWSYVASEGPFYTISQVDDELNKKVTANVAITGATKCKITYDSKGLVTAGADLDASDIPNLDTAKITSGTFADARIASASIWNAKTKVTLNGSDVATASIYAPISSGSLGQILKSNGPNSAPTWIDPAIAGKGHSFHFYCSKENTDVSGYFHLDIYFADGENKLSEYYYLGDPALDYDNVVGFTITAHLTSSSDTPSGLYTGFVWRDTVITVLTSDVLEIPNGTHKSYILLTDAYIHGDWY